MTKSKIVYLKWWCFYKDFRPKISKIQPPIHKLYIANQKILVPHRKLVQIGNLVIIIFTKTSGERSNNNQRSQKGSV